MGFPAKSPISDFFHGTMYMTFGCSRSPVTVAVPNSSRSEAPGGFCPGPEDARAAAPAARDVLARGSPASDCALAGREVLARGSPASDWAVALGGFAAGAEAGAGAAAGAAGSLAGAVAGAGCCALTFMARHSTVKLNV